MKKRSECFATEWNPDDEVVHFEEMGFLTVKELGECYGLNVHDLLSNPSDPDAFVGFATDSIDKVRRRS